MSEVATTQTAYDRTRELREIADEIAKLKSIRERAEEETRLALQAEEEVKSRVSEAEGLVETLLASLPDISRETRGFITSCQNIVRDASDSVAHVAEALRTLSDKAGESSVSLRATLSMKDEVHASIVIENEALDARKRDIGIYEARVKASVEEHLPGHVFIL